MLRVYGLLLAMLVGSAFVVSRLVDVSGGRAFVLFALGYFAFAQGRTSAAMTSVKEALKVLLSPMLWLSILWAALRGRARTRINDAVNDAVRSGWDAMLRKPMFLLTIPVFAAVFLFSGSTYTAPELLPASGPLHWRLLVGAAVGAVFALAHWTNILPDPLFWDMDDPWKREVPPDDPFDVDEVVEAVRAPSASELVPPSASREGTSPTST